MFNGSVYLAAVPPLLGIAFLGWLVSLAKRDASIVDSLWSLMFLAALGAYCAAIGDITPRGWLLLALVGIWSLRLSAYITWRNRGHGEDRRYQAIRKRNEPYFWLKSLVLVFVLQAALAWLISLPLLAGAMSNTALGPLDYLGVGLWLLGMIFEAGGDWQLSRFKADPANAGKVMDRGLWRYTRHPNYFGDTCVWWGFWLIALAAGGWWSVLGPLLMTALLLKVSGVALLERDISERRPEYRAYIERTNAFIPGPPAADRYTESEST